MLYFMDSIAQLLERRAMIVKMLVVGPLASNCYIVGSHSTKEGMIVDPGAEARTILKTVRQLGLSISLIVATHAHFDHIDALREVRESVDAQFALHEADQALLSATPPMSVMASLRLAAFEPYPQPDILLRDGDYLSIGDLRFQVLHTPGHTPGGVCLLGHGVVFSGDTLFNCGVGRTDFAGGSYERLIESIREKLMVLPDETVVYPGHGPPTTIGDERRGNPFLRDYPP
jgi:hydroxyacylglutathione hydrolase